MKNNKAFWIAIGVLLVPVAIFFLLNTGTNQYGRLPIYGNRIPPDGAGQTDTLYVDTVPDFTLTNQEGKTITKKDFENFIYVANFFFTNCEGACPRLSHEDSLIVHRIQQRAKENKEFEQVKFLSITVDPERDSVPVLAAYARRFDADSKIWHMCTSSKEEILKLNRGFLLPLEADGTIIDEITHSQRFVLVDKQHRIRGDYDGLDPNETQRLFDEIKVLLLEYDHK